MPLDLTPNEFVGYRIRPDWYSYTVCLVKKKGPKSKNPGQEYLTPVAYCKTISSAASWIFSHSVRVNGAANQDEHLKLSGCAADAKSLAAAFAQAQEHAISASLELEARLKAAGWKPKDLVHLLGGVAAADQPDTDTGSES